MAHAAFSASNGKPAVAADGVLWYNATVGLIAQRTVRNHPVHK